jgi:hypothetical protein
MGSRPDIPGRLERPDQFRQPTLFLPDNFDSLSELRRLYYSRWLVCPRRRRVSTATRCSCHDANPLLPARLYSQMSISFFPSAREMCRRGKPRIA